MKIFSGSANPPLADKIAKALELSVSPLDTFIFPDKEKRIRVVDNVVGEHAVVVQPTNTPADENYMELFFIIDACKRSGAEFVSAVVPYLGYQRQDHVFRDGEAVSLEVVIKTLQSTGIDKIISVDLHSSRIPDVFSFPIVHLSALPLFAKKIQEIEGQKEDMVLVSPDMGGIRRIKMLSEMLDDIPYAAIEKDRDLATGEVNSQNLGEGSVEGKKIAFIVDDMIASGNTIVKAADVLQKHGVEKMYVFATHAIFTPEAPQILQACNTEKVFVTDTVFISEEKFFPKLEIISVADIIAKQLREH